MPIQEQAQLCQLLSSLFLPPDEETVDLLHRGIFYSHFQHYVQLWEGDIRMLNGFLVEGTPPILLRNLRDEYHRLFSETGKEKIPLVESCYKPWTKDSHCTLSFASEKGLLMGDSAIHLSAIYQHCGIEVTEEFRGMPDHLVLEMEFLSHLYRWGGDPEIKMFIKDHLDWIPSLKEELKRVQAHPFYQGITEVLDLFLRTERKRLENTNDGKTKVD